MSGKRNTWDAELYEAQHNFVWKYGGELLGVLDAKPAERILDLGCGPGQLTSRISEKGAEVVGLDSSPEMIGQARQNYPALRFVLQDAASMRFENEFDAVFSNAALHWMLNMEAVAQAVSRALRPGSRFVAELGGKGNIRAIESAVADVLRRRGRPAFARKTHFPSIGEYATILESAPLEVRSAVLFDRPTPLEGPLGMENWLAQFGKHYFEELEPADRQSAVQETVEQLRSVLFEEGRWIADYRRLRITAVKR